MKAVILAGGLGTRLSEETDAKPKPMVEIGDRPLLWHIMKIYESYGITDFIVCLGYRGYVIKEYFTNYVRHSSDLHVDLATGAATTISDSSERWKITLVDTGANTMTGGRLARIAEHVGDSTFCVTYGDGLADVDITASLAFHADHKKLCTVTAVQPPGRFGVLSLDEADLVTKFEEKPSDEIGWINGGFFVMEPAALEYIAGDSTSWEDAPLVNLAADRQLAAFRHAGFFQPCDTLRDKRHLEQMWEDGTAPWRTWA
ncbi:MAG: glucose-1-phosphate cytidylyltransferase [Thermoleophilaceae bacterium]|nr:glucose-1-phosphate cytidylyltransferase [Thermoleophilaceae bacterium]